jgi:hypothetical protein
MPFCDMPLPLVGQIDLSIQVWTRDLCYHIIPPIQFSWEARSVRPCTCPAAQTADRPWQKARQGALACNGIVRTATTLLYLNDGSATNLRAYG